MIRGVLPGVIILGIAAGQAPSPQCPYIGDDEFRYRRNDVLAEEAA
jgi:hypothetical protein